MRVRVYPPWDIDKARGRGETWAVDPEIGEALHRLDTNLRGEMQTLRTDLRGEMQTLGTELRGEMATLRADLRGEIQTSAAETRAYVDERMEVFAAENRRYFDVVGESLRGEIRGLAELMPCRTSRGTGELRSTRGGPVLSRAGC